MEQTVHIGFMQYVTHLSILCTFKDCEVLSLLSNVGKEAAIAHEGHHHVWSRSPIHTDANEAKDIRVAKMPHLHALLQYVIYLALIVEPWKGKFDFDFIHIFGKWIFVHVHVVILITSI